jgi:molecular chaperone GrpE
MTSKKDKQKSKKETNSNNQIEKLKNLNKKREIQYKKFKENILNEKNKLIRNIADQQNLLNRNKKEYLIEKNKNKKKYLNQIVDILDLIKNAYNDKNSKEGIKLIINNIEKFLEDENVKYIKCIGKSFDHRIHHAITTIEKKDCKNNIIIDELKKGYYLNDEILRPSQVVVSKKNRRLVFKWEK